ncbi:unnamed protein product, partial [Discosporangium mesarthrocarpum]
MPNLEGARGLSSSVDSSSVPVLSQLITKELNRSTTGKVWNELLHLSRNPDVCNLGQGFPDYAGSSVAREAASTALLDPSKAIFNQYSMPGGMASLQQAICSYYNKLYDLKDGRDARAITPSNVLVTVGATEALYMAVKSFAGVGDEVIAFSPGFPWYVSDSLLSGATMAIVELEGPDFAPDLSKVEAVITPRTRVLLLNTPHNPCGHCYTEEELQGFARLAHKHNLVIISDEV